MRNQANSKAEGVQVLVSSQKTTDSFKLAATKQDAQSYSFAQTKMTVLSETGKQSSNQRCLSDDYQSRLTEICR
jgi:hypothetical protein